MEFGIFNSLYMPRQAYQDVDNQWDVETERLMNEIAWTKAADRSGFKYTWATEHHFLTEYSHLSSNECFLAYLAGTTQNIHLGTGIFNITPPVNHPARVAERVAMIDKLSGGRFEFGIGRGSSTTEQQGFGIRDPELTKQMVDEVYPEFKRMWRENDYSFEGEFFSMPPRNVLPKPTQDPHPPMWIAAGNPGTFEKAARMGVGVLCFTMGTPEQLAPLIEIYKKNIEKAEPVGEYVNNNMMVTSQMLCLEDGEKARDLVHQDHVALPEQPRVPLPRHVPHAAGHPRVAGAHPRADAAGGRAAIEAGDVCIGTPDEVAKAVKRYDDTGADQLVFGMLSTTMPIETAIEAIETFGKHVLPQFDKDPVASTAASARRTSPSGARGRRPSSASPRTISRSSSRLGGRPMASASTGGSRSSPARAGASGTASRCGSPPRAPRSRSRPARSNPSPTPARGLAPRDRRRDRGGGGRAVPVQADLDDADDRVRIVPEVEAALGPVDMLVNNAAAAFYLPNAEISLKRRRLMFELNVHAPIDLAQQVIPGMRGSGRAGS